jgi:hypothetical protein
MKPKRIAFFVVVAATVLGVSAASACGNTTTRVENTGANQQTGITVSGDGKATGKPDVAMLTLGVSKLANTVDAARNGAAASLDAMITSMTANGIAKDDIQTVQFNISPEYANQDGKQTLTGFRVSNVVSAKIRDITQTSKVVDDAVTAGGNDVQVQNIAFTIDKPDDLNMQARQAAVADAKAKAQTLATAAGVALGAPISISEGSVVTPLPFSPGVATNAGAGTPSTPIEPGTQDVTDSVSITWSIR